ncbi:uncharacterized protein [Macrobrachium rosenbergii]|uniref:uncharacterized protein n=1 Tax=Macrobrachium rosenbergii TaxID=79674 RepID=UPI0034D72E5F
MKYLGKLHYCLGVNIAQDDGNTFIEQSVYPKALLEKFGFENCKPVSTPVEANCTIERQLMTLSCLIMKNMSAVGSLLYLSTKTRPDRNFDVRNVAKYCSEPTTKHCSCIGYSDSDLAGDRNDRKSTSGYRFSLGSGLISWRTSKQSCVALSTAEAEYVALADAAEEAV